MACQLLISNQSVELSLSNITIVVDALFYIVNLLDISSVQNVIHTHSCVLSCEKTLAKLHSQHHIVTCVRSQRRPTV